MNRRWGGGGRRRLDKVVVATNRTTDKAMCGVCNVFFAIFFSHATMLACQHFSACVIPKPFM
jgi:hypothetical protein